MGFLPVARWCAGSIAMIAATACDLVGPAQRDSYVLVRVNGVALPYVTDRRVEFGTGRVFESVTVDGTLTLFSGGRFVLDEASEYLIDGALDPRFTHPVRLRLAGDYSRTDSTIAMYWNLSARILDGGRVVAVTDESGLHDWATWEFERR